MPSLPSSDLFSSQITNHSGKLRLTERRAIIIIMRKSKNFSNVTWLTVLQQLLSNLFRDSSSQLPYNLGFPYQAALSTKCVTLCRFGISMSLHCLVHLRKRTQLSTHACICAVVNRGPLVVHTVTSFKKLSAARSIDAPTSPNAAVRGRSVSSRNKKNPKSEHP